MSTYLTCARLACLRTGLVLCQKQACMRFAYGSYACLLPKITGLPQRRFASAGSFAGQAVRRRLGRAVQSAVWSYYGQLDGGGLYCAADTGGSSCGIRRRSAVFIDSCAFNGAVSSPAVPSLVPDYPPYADQIHCRPAASFTGAQNEYLNSKKSAAIAAAPVSL